MGAGAITRRTYGGAMTHYDQIYIDGAWIASSGTGTIDVYDSTNGEVIAAVPDGTPEDVEKAAQSGGRLLRVVVVDDTGRAGQVLHAIADGLQARLDEIATVVTREAGMPKWLSQLVQVGLPVNSFNIAAQVAESVPYEQEMGTTLLVREPVGVCGLITPWN